MSDRKHDENVEVAIAVAKGQKGDKGEKGTPGEGMSRSARRSIIFLFALALAIGTANLLFAAREVNAVQAASASTYQLCQAGNDSRAQQVRLWEFIITISHPPPHETAAAERQRLTALRTFNAYLHRVFAPRDCAAYRR